MINAEVIEPPNVMKMVVPSLIFRFCFFTRTSFKHFWFFCLLSLYLFPPVSIPHPPLQTLLHKSSLPYP
jgi:hypothetical protein